MKVRVRDFDADAVHVESHSVRGCIRVNGGNLVASIDRPMVGSTWHKDAKLLVDVIQCQLLVASEKTYRDGKLSTHASFG